MVDNKYARAYTEALEIIKNFPEEEYNKIPKEKIKFFEDNMDKDYKFTIDPEKELEVQGISKEAYAVIVVLFQDYFATEKQKEKINNILRLNEIKAEQEKKEKYNPEELFEKVRKNETINQESKEELALVNINESFFVRLKRFIFRILHI